MLTGLALLFVGAVLFVNGIWLFGRIADREIVFINLFVGSITFLIAMVTALRVGAEIGTIKSAGLTLLFSGTYLWVATNRMFDFDGRGLGWFSLFIAVTVAPVAVQDLLAAETVLGMWLAISWGIWAGLWFMYFLLLTLGRPIQRATAWVTLLSGVITGWLPGILLLNGVQ
ncbi:MAG: AmiS/UreI family transporter [Pikeienuella sp.]